VTKKQDAGTSQEHLTRLRRICGALPGTTERLSHGEPTFFAGRRDVIRLVLRGAFQRVAVGLLLGIPLAIGAGRLMAARLYQVGSWDPVSLSIAVGALAACAFVAAIVPAARAAALDPTTALRTE